MKAFMQCETSHPVVIARPQTRAGLRAGFWCTRTARIGTRRAQNSLGANGVAAFELDRAQQVVCFHHVGIDLLGFLGSNADFLLSNLL